MKIYSIVGMLMAGFPRRLRALMGGLCAIIALPLVLEVIFISAPFDKAASVAIFFAIDIALIWALFAHGSRVLLTDARSLRIPGVTQAWCATVVLFLLASVLLPAIFFGLRWNVFAVILPVYLCAAAAGMLLLMIPTRTPAFFWPVWIALMLLREYLPTSSNDGLWMEQPLLREPMATWTLSAIFCALAVWRWRALILHSDRTNPARLRAIAADAGGKATVANDAYREKRIAGAGARWPIVAMRCWLGGPFVPQAWATNWPALLVGGACFAAITHKIGAMAPIALGIAIFPLPIYWAQLRRLFAKQGGEVAELALLPGWGDSATVRSTVLTAVLQPMVNYLMAAVVVIEILGWLVHMDAATRWSMACSLVIAASAGAVYCLYALSHRPPAFLLNAYLICVGSSVGILSVASCFGIHWIDIPAWLVLTAVHCGVMALFARSAYVDFHQEPHPFLTK